MGEALFISKAIRATQGGRGGSREEGRTQKSPRGLWQQQNPQPRRVCPDHLFAARSSLSKERTREVTWVAASATRRNFRRFPSVRC